MSHWLDFFECSPDVLIFQAQLSQIPGGCVRVLVAQYLLNDHYRKPFLEKIECRKIRNDLFQPYPALRTYQY